MIPGMAKHGVTSRKRHPLRLFLPGLECAAMAKGTVTSSGERKRAFGQRTKNRLRLFLAVLAWPEWRSRQLLPVKKSRCRRLFLPA